jgi:hypothetical protein
MWNNLHDRVGGMFIISKTTRMLVMSVMVLLHEQLWHLPQMAIEKKCKKYWSGSRYQACSIVTTLSLVKMASVPA